jgi:hypothetical protein
MEINKNIRWVNLKDASTDAKSRGFWTYTENAVHVERNSVRPECMSYHFKSFFLVVQCIASSDMMFYFQILILNCRYLTVSDPSPFCTILKKKSGIIIRQT